MLTGEVMRTLKRIIVTINSRTKSLFDLFNWLVVHCFISDFRNHIKRIQKGETIDIIVNGPSFSNQIDVVKNDGFDKCMVNFAANTPLFWEIRPIYYCVSDPHFFLNADKDERVKTFINTMMQVDWDISFFVPYYDYKHHIKKTNLDKLDHIKFVPFHSTPLPLSFKFKKIAFGLFRMGQAMPKPMSVAVPAIMNAINSGYSSINLYGFDQNWIHNVVVNENNQVCLQDTHFYDEKGKLIPWMKTENETWKMYEVLQTQVELFESYWFIKEYADHLGNTKIINKSPSSLLDAFDRE